MAALLLLCFARRKFRSRSGPPRRDRWAEKLFLCRALHQALCVSEELIRLYPEFRAIEMSQFSPFRTRAWTWAIASGEKRRTLNIFVFLCGKSDTRYNEERAYGILVDTYCLSSGRHSATAFSVIARVNERKRPTGQISHKYQWDVYSWSHRTWLESEASRQAAAQSKLMWKNRCKDVFPVHFKRWPHSKWIFEYFSYCAGCRCREFGSGTRFTATMPRPLLAGFCGRQIVCIALAPTPGSESKYNT